MPIRDHSVQNVLASFTVLLVLPACQPIMYRGICSVQSTSRPKYTHTIPHLGVEGEGRDSRPNKALAWAILQEISLELGIALQSQASERMWAKSLSNCCRRALA